MAAALDRRTPAQDRQGAGVCAAGRVAAGVERPLGQLYGARARRVGDVLGACRRRASRLRSTLPVTAWPIRVSYVCTLVVVRGPGTPSIGPGLMPSDARRFWISAISVQLIGVSGCEAAVPMSAGRLTGAAGGGGGGIAAA